MMNKRFLICAISGVLLFSSAVNAHREALDDEVLTNTPIPEEIKEEYLEIPSSKNEELF